MVNQVPVKKEKSILSRRRNTLQKNPTRHRNSRRKLLIWILVFLAPAVIAIAVLRVLPAIEAVKTSFYTGVPGGVQPPTFAGLENYLDLWSNEAFRETVIRTLVFNLIINPLQIILALAIALVMTKKVYLRGLWRTLVFIPTAVPIVGSTIVWGIALRPKGPVNTIIAAFGGSPQQFFTSPNQALASIMLVASWIGIGFWMLFLIAGLNAIPQEYYEAARLDRAGPIRSFFSITIPLLKRPILFVLVANTVANFVLFVPVQMLTNGGPESSTNLLMFDAYRTSFTYGNHYLGSAEVVILTLIMLAIVLVQFRLLREDRPDRGT